MRIAIAAGMLGLLAATALGAEEPRVAEACAADHARLCSEASINSTALPEATMRSAACVASSARQTR
mgnify:CR=1 FL=1